MPKALGLRVRYNKIGVPLSRRTSTPATISRHTTLNHAAVVQGVGDDGCSLPSPSGVNTLAYPSQAAVFFSVCAGLYLLTQGLIVSYESLVTVVPFVSKWQTTFPILGLIYAAAGVAHFTVKDGFVNIMPKPGAWGFWYLPLSKEFHVIWTGIAEILLGTGLFLGFIGSLLSQAGADVLISNSALGLLVLTILVTPANIYMFTHGARLPVDGPEIPVSFHAVRLFLQAVLFFQFYELARPAISTFFGVS